MTPTSDDPLYQPLPKIYKNRYPFRLSVPSFVYPDTWAANARMLAPFVDEIELLFFESKKEGCLPSREEIDALVQISKDFSLGYNIHLPTDISLAAADRAEQDRAFDVFLRMIDSTSKLDPSGWTVHIPCDASGRNGTEVTNWQGRVRAGLEKLLSAGIQPGRLAVENLDYTFGWLEDLVWDLGLSVCMDVGHLLLRGEDVTDFYRRNIDRITILHLHGVQNQKDHLPMTVMPREDGLLVVEILNDFSGTLSLEVFSYDHLVASMGWLEAARFAD